jgi:hypothetical protein
VASTGLSENPVNLEIGVVNGRTFIFSAEDASGLRVYEYASSQVTFKGAITSRTKLVGVRGSGSLPYVFQHRLDSSGKSYIDIYDTRWLVNGGTPHLGASLPTLGSPDHFLAYGFDAVVDDAAPAAYVYREANPVPPQTEQNFGTTKVSLSCLSGGPNPTPTPTPTPGVAPNQFAHYIEWAKAAGITGGCGGGNFCPSQDVRRDQLMAFLYNLYVYVSTHPGPVVPLPPCQHPPAFLDVGCSDAATVVSP